MSMSVATMSVSVATIASVSVVTMAVSVSVAGVIAGRVVTHNFFNAGITSVAVS